MLKPTIGLIQGDACGIGPELLAKLLDQEKARERANILILSDKRIYDAGEAVAGLTTDVQLIDGLEQIDFSNGNPYLLHTALLDPAELQPGSVSSQAGRAVLENLGQGIDLAMEGRVDGLCYMPFNKEAMHAAGMGVADELSWIKQRLHLESPASEFNVVDAMWNARVTSHIPLKEVSSQLNQNRILQAIQLADQTLGKAGVAPARIAVAALNPHAGEGGTLGREEIEIISPAIEEAKRLEINVEGPFPSDTLYLKIRDGHYDCAVSMYHDQGQIAIKLLGFDRGVSVLAGLPFPMTTPAHGTAFDIVGMNTANVQAATNALMMACDMAQN